MVETSEKHMLKKEISLTFCLETKQCGSNTFHSINIHRSPNVWWKTTNFRLFSLTLVVFFSFFGFFSTSMRREKYFSRLPMANNNNEQYVSKQKICNCSIVQSVQQSTACLNVVIADMDIGPGSQH